MHQTNAIPRLPVGKWNEWDTEPRARTVLLQSFQLGEQLTNSCTDVSSSLFLRDIYQQSIELWDVQEHPPRKIKLDFARPILRATERRSYFDEAPPLSCTESTASPEPIPCLCLQTITLGQTRVVLAQTLAERTFHVIDQYGQPYLTHNVGAAQLPRSRSRRRNSRRASKNVPAAPVIEDRHQKYIVNPSGCGKRCEGRCQRLEWVDLKITRNWKALRLPRRRESDTDPGIFFYYVRDEELPDDCMSDRHTVLEWALLLARPDRNSSDTMTSGEIDLASFTASHPSPPMLPRRLNDLDLQVLSDPSDGGGHILQIYWQERRALAMYGWYGENFGTLVHIPLDSLNNSAEEARSQAATDPFNTPEWRLRGIQSFRLSNDALRLFTIEEIPNDDPEVPEEFAVLVYERRTARESWPSEPLVQRNVGVHRRIIGVFDDWLIMADDWSVSVNLLRMTSPYRELQKFQLHGEEFEHKSDPYDVDRPKRPDHTWVLLAGGWIVLRADENIVKAILHLSAPAGPAFVDVDQIIRTCLATHGLPNCEPSPSDSHFEAERKTRKKRSHGQMRFRLICYGDIDPNPPQAKLCPDEPRKSAHSEPLVLFVCSELSIRGSTREEDEEFGDTIEHEQYVLLLHPGSAAIESVRYCADDDLIFFCDQGFLLQAATRGRRRLFLDQTDEVSVRQLLVDFDTARVYPQEPLEHRAVVLGRWTNDNAKQMLVHSPHALDPQKPNRRWFLLWYEDMDPPEITTDDAHIQDSDEEEDSMSQSEMLADGGDWTREFYKESLPYEIYRALELYENGREYHHNRIRLLPNWLLCGPRTLYIGGLQRLLAFLTRPETTL